jgi:hypothetical protein
MIPPIEVRRDSAAAEFVGLGREDCDMLMTGLWWTD